MMDVLLLAMPNFPPPERTMGAVLGDYDAAASQRGPR